MEKENKKLRAMIAAKESEIASLTSMLRHQTVTSLDEKEVRGRATKQSMEDGNRSSTSSNNERNKESGARMNEKTRDRKDEASRERDRDREREKNRNLDRETKEQQAQHPSHRSSSSSSSSSSTDPSSPSSPSNIPPPSSSSISVFARIRPSPHIAKHLVSIDSGGKSIDFKLEKGESGSGGGNVINNKRERYQFQFDQLFGEKTTQAEMFEYVAKPVVQSVLDGYNGTIFAYVSNTHIKKKSGV